MVEREKVYVIFEGQKFGFEFAGELGYRPEWEIDKFFVVGENDQEVEDMSNVLWNNMKPDALDKLVAMGRDKLMNRNRS